MTSFRFANNLEQFVETMDKNADDTSDLELLRTFVTVIGIAAITRIVPVCWRFYKYATRTRKRPFPNIRYCAPDPHWFFGHVKLIGADIIKGTKVLCVDHASPEGVCSFWTLQCPVVSVLGLQDAQQILRSNYDRQWILRKHNAKLLGETSVALATEDTWRSNRTVFRRAFTGEAVKSATKQLIASASRVVDSIGACIDENGGELSFDFHRLCKMATLDTFGMACFGFDFGCLANNQIRESELYQSYEFLQKDFIRRGYEQRANPFAQYYCIPTFVNRKHARVLANVRGILGGLLQDRIDAVREAQPAEDATCLLDHLVRSLMDSDGTISHSNSFLTDLMQTMLAGGYDSSSTALSLSCYMICRHPQVEAICLQEIEQVMGDADSLPLDCDPTTDLLYCCAVIYETLRMYPPIPLTSRLLSKASEVTIDGQPVTLSRGTKIVLALCWINNHPMNFSMPEKFLPERWVKRTEAGVWEWRGGEDDDDDDNKHCGVKASDPRHLLSFSAGSRNCVGKPFALRQTATILAFLVRKLKMGVAADYKLSFVKAGATQSLKGGLPMTLKRR